MNNVEAPKLTDQLQEQEGYLVARMWDADAIMQHLDQTFWLGDDVPEQLAALRQHLQQAVVAIDAYVPVRQQWDAERMSK